ncbi:MAG: MOSC domain-containing protein [Myxococcales bacterium]|nr:MAG: MOSC domain-containing protein [Myxococcales bacterium]
MRLSGIFVYPIKSCGGISLTESEVAERGLASDRRYMLVDRTGRFVSQREEPRLCQVKVAFEGERLRATAPGAAPLGLPRELEGVGLEPRPYRVWESEGRALREPEGSRWFSEFLQAEVSLLYMPDSERRAVSPKRARPEDIVSFADGYPLLLISEASLQELNSRLERPLEMQRFRPNLVVSGCDPYAEDTFTSLRIGEVSFRGVKRCERCVITTLDPETGEGGKEPLRTLAKYRLREGKVWFGMNLIHDGPGTLRLGDEVYLQ